MAVCTDCGHEEDPRSGKCPGCPKMSPGLIAFYEGQEPGRDYERELAQALSEGIIDRIYRFRDVNK
jgi:predicted ATP-dependent serine protease